MVARKISQCFATASLYLFQKCLETCNAGTVFIFIVDCPGYEAFLRATKKTKQNRETNGSKKAITQILKENLGWTHFLQGFRNVIFTHEPDIFYVLDTSRQIPQRLHSLFPLSRCLHILAPHRPNTYVGPHLKLEHA